jgi:hypothetical protein
MQLEDSRQQCHQQKSKSIFLFFKQVKPIVEIKILYKFLIVYVHKIILVITKLKVLFVDHGW